VLNRNRNGTSSRISRYMEPPLGAAVTGESFQF